MKRGFVGHKAGQKKKPIEYHAKAFDFEDFFGHVFGKCVLDVREVHPGRAANGET